VIDAAACHQVQSADRSKNARRTRSAGAAMTIDVSMRENFEAAGMGLSS
jgi:hypothetical protein